MDDSRAVILLRSPFIHVLYNTLGQEDVRSEAREHIVSNNRRSRHVLQTRPHMLKALVKRVTVYGAR